MPYYVYVSLQDDDKILVFTMNAETGKLTPKAAVPVSGGPVGLAVNPDGNFLYVGRRWEYDIASFRIDQTNGGLTQIGSAPVQGEPLDVAIDRKGNYVLSYYYAQRTAAVHRIENGAAVTPAVEWVMPAFGAHDFQTDPSNRFAFVPHIGDWGEGELTRSTSLNSTKTPATSRPTLLPYWNQQKIWGRANFASILSWTPFTPPTSRAPALPLIVLIRGQERCRRFKPYQPCPRATLNSTRALR